jgi:hypothetical protein
MCYSNIVQGSPPSVRHRHGFTSSNGKLFVFAGVYFPGYFNPGMCSDDKFESICSKSVFFNQ